MKLLLTALAGFLAATALPAETPQGNPLARCQPLSEPAILPNLDALVDSVALLARVLAMDPPPSGEVVVSVWLMKRPTGHVVGDSARTRDGAALLTSVLASLRPAAKQSPAAFRVHLQQGRTPLVRLERSILCKPELIDNGTIDVLVQGRVKESARPPTGPPEPRQVTTRLRVSTSGKVVTVLILAGGSGYPGIDRAIADDARRTRYSPARLDGRPVEVWLSPAGTELVR